MREQDLTIVINTFNSDEKIFSCINSIDQNIKIIIIENSDNLRFKNNLEQKYKNVTCYLAEDNLGYAKGNNLGLSMVKTRYALILNPDTVLEKNAIKNFFINVQQSLDFAIIGPAIQKKEDNSNIILNDEKNLREVEYVKGFAMFLNLKQFENVGFFDENFFIYLEEIDLCKRLKNKRKKIYLDKKIIVHHLGGSSHNESINFEMELSRNWHWMWSTYYFNKKHFGITMALITISGKLFSSIIKLIFYASVLNKKKKEIYAHRLSGLINSIIGKKSWYRPKIITN